jgi:hypothetical protein
MFNVCYSNFRSNKRISWLGALQNSQYQNAQNPIWPAPIHPKPKQPVSKQPKFIMPTFKTSSVRKPSFFVSRLVFNMRTKLTRALGRHDWQSRLSPKSPRQWNCQTHYCCLTCVRLTFARTKKAAGWLRLVGSTNLIFCIYKKDMYVCLFVCPLCVHKPLIWL